MHVYENHLYIEEAILQCAEILKIIIEISTFILYNTAMKILTVTEKYNNKKLITFLQDNFTNLSNGAMYRALRKKDIKINEKRVSENCLLKTGDEVKIYIADELLYPQIEVPIVYEDENIMVYDKPIGLEIQGENSLTSYAKNYLKSYIEPCHRLDRNTSGLVLFAKNPDSLKILLDAFKNHLIEKHYTALVYGIPPKKSQKLTAYLFKDSKKSLVYISDRKIAKYQEIVTYYRLLKQNTEKNISLLDITLETGRTHQIRAHLAHIGLPIIGDGKYGINTVNKNFKQKTQLLSSYSLTFRFNKQNRLSYLNNKTISKDEIPFINLL